MTKPGSLDPAAPPKRLAIGGWLVHPALRRLDGPDGEVVHLEPKVLAVLLELAARPSEVVTREELLDRVWDGGAVTESVLSRAISTLRKAFGDPADQPRYLETIRKTGYRLVAPVAEDRPAGATEPTAPPRRKRRARWPLLLWLAGPLALAIVLFPREERPAEPAWPRPLTSLQGSELDPVLSPDGEQLAFAWNGEGGADFDIYVRPLEGGAPVRLTDHPGEEKNPAWSPDGDRLAFVRDAPGEEGVFTVPVAGGEARRLAGTLTGDIPDLVWSADGRYLFFPDRAAPGHPTAIARLELSSGERRWITRPPPTAFGDRDLALAPDGRRIAFARAAAPGVEDLWVADVPLGEESRLTRDGQSITGIEWLPESDELLFASTRDGLSRFWRIPATGGSPRVDAGLGEDGYDPSFAPAVGRLVFERKVYETNIWRVPLAIPGEPVVWIQSTRNDNSPAISANGQWIAFVSDRSGPAELWICNADGGEAFQLTRLAPALPGAPAWTPDGRALVVSLRKGTETDLVRIEVAEGRVEPLTSTPWQELFPTLSRDGRWVYFGSDRDGAWRIWKLPIEGGRAERVTEDGGLRALEAADGSLYYSRLERPGVWRRSPAGDREEPVYLPDEGTVGLDWTLGARGVYLRALTPDPVAARPLLLLDPRSGEVREVVPPLSRVGLFGLGLSVSPDGAYLLFGRTDRSDGDIMRVEGYR